MSGQREGGTVTVTRRLVVTDSPAKAPAVRAGLAAGDELLVAPGEWRTLAEPSDPARGEPAWQLVPGRRRALEELREAAAGAAAVVLLPDPDRAGAAWAWHLAELLGPALGERLLCARPRELTPEVIAAELARSNPVEDGGFRAWETERLAERRLAMALHPLLGASHGLSWAACVALRLVCDREIEIEAFDPEPRFALRAELEAARGGRFTARHLGEGSVPSALTESVAVALERRLESARFRIARVRSRRRSRRPEPPFTTASLLKAAFERLSFSASRAGAIAHRLYEGKALGDAAGLGLITHWVTGSTRVSEGAAQAARRRLAAELGEESLPERRPAEHGPPGEAIRPTRLDRDPNSVAAHLARDELALYELVWKRFLASQLRPAVLRETAVEVSAGRARLGAAGESVLSAGFLAANGPRVPPTPLPALREEEPARLVALEREELEPRPPDRFNDATLLEALLDCGVGRPAAIAATIAALEECGLVVRSGADLHPTRLGQRVAERLAEGHPGLVDAQAAAEFGRRLAAIEGGRDSAAAALAQLDAALGPAAGKRSRGRGRGGRRGQRCPDCGRGRIVERAGRGQRSFYACDRYPDCRFRSPYPPAPGPCPDCGRPVLFEKRTRREGWVRFCADRSCGHRRVVEPAG